MNRFLLRDTLLLRTFSSSPRSTRCTCTLAALSFLCVVAPREQTCSHHRLHATPQDMAVLSQLHSLRRWGAERARHAMGDAMRGRREPRRSLEVHHGEQLPAKEPRSDPLRRRLYRDAHESTRRRCGVGETHRRSRARDTSAVGPAPPLTLLVRARADTAPARRKRALCAIPRTKNSGQLDLTCLSRVRATRCTGRICTAKCACAGAIPPAHAQHVRPGLCDQAQGKRESTRLFEAHSPGAPMECARDTAVFRPAPPQTPLACAKWASAIDVHICAILRMPLYLTSLKNVISSCAPRLPTEWVGSAVQIRETTIAYHRSCKSTIHAQANHAPVCVTNTACASWNVKPLLPQPYGNHAPPPPASVFVHSTTDAQLAGLWT
ncbi:hypothetical protein B0H13DRAFT_2316698 [Mycena leptocephala]|nr:hypothetical protein B0H13DRAFT_2316698 [Mycena leptocephala]